MLGFLRLIVFGFIALSVVFVCLSLYSRSVRRRKLREEWNAGSLEGTPPGKYEEFMAQGMAEYETSLRRKLIWGVYVVPICVVMLIVYLTNFA